jgi:hypothetical protein
MKVKGSYCRRCGKEIPNLNSFKVVLCNDCKGVGKIPYETKEINKFKKQGRIYSLLNKYK